MKLLIGSCWGNCLFSYSTLICVPDAMIQTVSDMRAALESLFRGGLLVGYFAALFD